MYERNSLSAKLFRVVFRIGHSFSIFTTREFEFLQSVIILAKS